MNQTSEILRAVPGMQRTPTPKLELFRLRGFLDADECERLMQMIDANRQPSTQSDDNGDPTYRTSETCYFGSGDAFIAEVDRKLHDLLGIPEGFSEPLQGQRYEVGQEFKNHTDYFEPGGADLQKRNQTAGQRTWTAMVYLNAPEAGGATRFKAIKKTVVPERGALLAWNNLKPDGSPNFSTLHHGMKVRAGTKYVITKWFTERPWPRSA
ncbi:oxygenase [Pacificimonas flava]|uniref:Oxygenase n=2 Tax=Pacificimonas TaxID=1960290 RepID=A0A219B1P6_9SPHN|nr:MULTISPECIES: 2OG-Fe(II) oxygenase [Pacificimonas]MBZ6378077.1 2OG-Fe(II) oxygenase [Pacificimonas aurantium]OWV32282.1 oxygenase [Pacificimonas flava]